MNVTFCDACGIECQRGSLQFAPLVHVVEESDGKMSGYVDLDGNSVSGQAERFDLCHKCYNIVFFAAMKAFRGIESSESA